MRNSTSSKEKSAQIKIRKKSKFEHGGDYANRKRRGQRPLEAGKPTHLVLKSNRTSKMQISFTRSRNLIENVIKHQAERAKVRVYSMAIVGNHVHLAIYFKERAHYVRFIRGVTGHLISSFKTAQKIT